MDSTKNPLAVVTMVHGDYLFLKRWYDYYKAQVGAENLYIFSHGNDPKHREIAAEANVIALPRDETMHMFDRRRWRMLSRFVSGLSQFYNWVILSDVDEIVIVDPKAASGILEYIELHYPDTGAAPKNIAPLCMEIIHYPPNETLPVEEDKTILSRRRTYRPSRNYSKPCLVRGDVVFKAGGHLNNLAERHMPADMYLLHLKYFDHEGITQRSTDRSETILGAGNVSKNFATMGTWYDTGDYHSQILEKSTFIGEEIELKEFRAKLAKQKERARGKFVYGYAKTNNLYQIPERFSDVF